MLRNGRALFWASTTLDRVKKARDLTHGDDGDATDVFNIFKMSKINLKQPYLH